MTEVRTYYDVTVKLLNHYATPPAVVNIYFSLSQKGMNGVIFFMKVFFNQIGWNTMSFFLKSLFGIDKVLNGCSKTYVTLLRLCRMMITHLTGCLCSQQCGDNYKK